MSPPTAAPPQSEESPATQTPTPAGLAPQIQYESAASPISRRHFRLHFMLTVINTLMLFIFVAGPVISHTLTGWQHDYKQWQADRAAKQLAARQLVLTQQKFAADLQAALQFNLPPTQVIYEEDPDRAAKLSANGSDYISLRPRNAPPTPTRWQTPVMHLTGGAPAIFQNFPQPVSSSQSAIVFLHSRKTPGGIERVVIVALAAEVAADEKFRLEFDPRPTTKQIAIRNSRSLYSAAFAPKTNTALTPGAFRALYISQEQNAGAVLTWHIGESQKWETARIESNLKETYRIFAGQPDPKDDSHFTIPYELDSQPSIMDGWLLNDETVLLAPRQGTTSPISATGDARRWDPHH